MTPAVRRVAARGLIATMIAVAGFEGVRTVSYLDPVGIPTACFGETENIRMGMRFTMDQCEEMLAERIIEFDDGVTACLGFTPPPGPRGAFVSFAYNVGVDSFCRSTLARKARAGDMAGACAELDRWVYAKGLKLPGLVKRRAQERVMCEAGLPVTTGSISGAPAAAWSWRSGAYAAPSLQAWA